MKARRTVEHPAGRYINGGWNRFNNLSHQEKITMFLLAESTGGSYVAVGCEKEDRIKIFHLCEKPDGTKYLVNLGGAYFVHMFNDETIRVIELLFPYVDWRSANDDQWPENISKGMVEQHEKTQTNEPFSLLRPMWNKEQELKP